jgi:hypothetical protein
MRTGKSKVTYTTAQASILHTHRSCHSHTQIDYTQYTQVDTKDMIASCCRKACMKQATRSYKLASHTPDSKCSDGHIRNSTVGRTDSGCMHPYNSESTRCSHMTPLHILLRIRQRKLQPVALAQRARVSQKSSSYDSNLSHPHGRIDEAAAFSAVTLLLLATPPQ